MRKLVPRLLFLAFVAGGLVWWSQLRRPRDLRLAVDLTAMMPGNVTEVDVIVRRGGHALARHEGRYGGGGAPATVELIVHAAPGGAEGEADPAYAEKAVR